MVLLSFGGSNTSGDSGSGGKTLSSGSSTSGGPTKMSKGHGLSLGERPIDHGIDVDKVIHLHHGSHKHTKDAFQYSPHVIEKPNSLAFGDL